VTIPNNHSKISVTAKLVAYFRQFSDIPFAQEIAESIGAEESFQSLIKETGISVEQLREFAPVFEARYKSIVSLILKSGIEQVLELASGFSLRGFAMTREAPLAYIESDLDDLTAEKTSLISSLPSKAPDINCGNHQMLSANALDYEQLKTATSKFSRSKRLAIVNEGLIQYFSVHERELLAKNVHQLLQEFGGGIWITPDFSFKAEVENVSEARKRLREAVTGATDRTLYEAAFDNEEALNKFFVDSGFTAQLHYQVDETPKFASVEKLNLSPQFVERLRPRLRVWVLS
jgi:O-methyltransferase involved in polyketide biosynthesis